MAAPGDVASTFFKQHSDTTQERLGRTARELLPQINPLFDNLVLSDAQVVTDTMESGLGRDMKIKRRYYGALAGKVVGGNTRDHFSLVGDNTQSFGDRLYTQDVTHKWPTDDSARAADLKWTGQLHTILTQLYLTMPERAAENNSAVIRKFIRPKMKGMARNIALTISNMWFADDANTLATVGDAANITLDASNHRITISGIKTIRRFEKGLPVDFYNPDSSGYIRLNEEDSASTRVRVFVETRDPWQEEATFVYDPNADVADSSGWITNIAANTRITIAEGADRDSTEANFGRIYNWRDWFVPGGSSTSSDNRILRGRADASEFIDVDVNEEFKSGYYSGVGTLTSRKLMNYLATAKRALEPNGHFLDCGVFSEGILENMLEQLQATRYRDGDKPLRFSGYTTDTNTLTLQWGNRKMQVFTGDQLEDGTVLFFRKSNNWEVVVPPDARGNTGAGPSDMKKDVFDKIPFRFAFSELGMGSAEFPVLDSTNNMPTIYTMLPGFAHMQIMPREQIPGMVLTGVNSTRELGNDGPIST